jgi:probable F420-dependent oxidoreductase
VKPQLTIWVPTLSPDDPVTWQRSFDIAIAADRAGVDRVALTGEHVIFGENLEAYGRAELGGRTGSTQATGPDGHYLEPIVAMSMIAAMTRRVRFIPNIMLAALRRPVILAKMTATLAVLSGDRLDLGVGVGWQREEYEAAGLSFETRGRQLDHTLEICRLLWSEPRASYRSAELGFENIHMMPKPPVPIPVWVSGTVSPPAMRRLAKFGSGWIPWGDATQDNAALANDIGKMREAVTGFGGDAAMIQVAGTLPVQVGAGRRADIGRTMEKVPNLAAAGVTDFRAQLPIPQEIDEAEDYLAGWVEGFQSAIA